ncbi:MAG TPA: septum formation initiator family protein [Candidatus Microbacterium stercoravium]|uniref:Septum formation initiator family protein n=1 Tax=Candidatus Microbacterium stercoravium TaxID=2838697 RepID=A0A9D2KIE3_9MICO|nr:septum formation initiator family protein [Candidatus Microbacterium stercoravium]
MSAREWLGGIRLSGFAVIMLGLVIMGAFILVPSASSYIDLRQQVAQAEAGIQLTEQEIADLERERDRWRDPAFITSEARERLYYVKPGEVVYLIEDDIERDDAAEPDPVDADVEEARDDWMGTMLTSIVTSGLAQQGTSGDSSLFQ